MLSLSTYAKTKVDSEKDYMNYQMKIFKLLV